MKASTRAASAFLSLAVLLTSCVDGDGTTGPHRGGATSNVAIQPALIPTPADGDAAPINRIRTVTVRVSDNAVLDRSLFDVSPTADSWELTLSIPALEEELVVEVFLYLLNVTAATETVEFSGRSGPITLVPGEEVAPDIPFVRGPLANLAVTGVTVTSAPQTMVVSTSQELTAEVTTSGSDQPTVFWTSLDEGIITMTGSTATAVGLGTVEIIASAGAYSDTISITVNDLLTVTTTSLPSGVPDFSYSATLAAAGGAGSYTWRIASGSLPPGLTLNTSTGEISGTPTEVGSSTFTVEVTSGDGQVATRSLTIDVYGPVQVTTSSLPSGTVNAAYGPATLQATGGDGSYAWRITAGSLPAGLSLDGQSGTISGTPTTEGTSTFTVEVTSGDGQTATRQLAIEVIAGGLGQIVGVVFDAVTGQVIAASTVTLTGGSLSLEVLTDGSGSYTFSGVPPGTYSVIATADGYVDNTAANLQVVDLAGTVVRADFALPPIGSTQRFGGLSGRVFDELGNPLGGATVSISGGAQTNGIFRSTTTNSDGTYSLVGIVLDDVNNEPIAQFTVLASATGYKTAQMPVDLIENETLTNVDFSLSLSEGVTVFFEDGFESDLGWDPSGFWNRSTLQGEVNTAYPTYVDLAPNDPSQGTLPSPIEGSFAWWYGVPGQGNFLGEQLQDDTPGSGGTSLNPNSGALVSPPFLVPVDASNATLRFDTWFEIESVNPNASGFDVMTVSVLDEGSGTLTELGRLNPFVDPTLPDRFAIPFTSGGFNAVPVWRTEFVDLSQFLGRTVRLVFTFDTFDTLYNGFRGWLIDRVSVSDAPLPAGAPSLAPPVGDAEPHTRDSR